MKLIILAIAVGIASAACPNGCSGHGSCGTSDVCGCYNGWWGGDCSYRSCPNGISWTATSYDDLTDDRNTDSVILNTPGAHTSQGDVSTEADVWDALYPLVPAVRQYSECSSRGTCDYATGQCKCFSGYEGKGCRRSSCPNGCSGHGRCVSNTDVSGTWSYMKNNDQFWDQEMTQQCSCDRGFTGYDCSDRVCPFGDDPTTECGENSADDYQMVSVLSSGSDYFTLTFKDMFGGTFETRPISVAGCTKGSSPSSCREVQFALMELPNFAIPNVEVDLMGTSTGTSSTTGGQTEFLYRVHFSDSSNTGKQNTLSCSTNTDEQSADTAGSSPMYTATTGCATYDIGYPEWFDTEGGLVSLSTLASSLTISDALADTTAGTQSEMDDVVTAGSDSDVPSYDSFVPCANKGLCDGSSGNCACADGHYGEACEMQSTYY